MPLTTPLVAQLRRSGSTACREVTYSTALRSDRTQFNAKSD